jgi:Ala-tRNA(Pro) deacylase
MLRANHGAKHSVVVAPATKRVDLDCVSEALGGVDVELATESEMLKQCPGCEFGVVPVFGSHFGIKTMVDESVAKQDQIVIQGDTHEEAVRMRYRDFFALEQPRVASIVGSHHAPGVVA